jgi:diacylglycerol kinase family enzyme
VRVLLIHNPGAGKHAKEDVDRLLALIRECGHEVRYKSAKDDDWAKALEEPADLVAVAGGDGTVARAIKKMVGRGVPVAPLPAGTANNIATMLGIVGRPLEDLVHGWQEARRVKLDVGVAEGPWGKRYFVEGVGAGLFAQTVPLVDSDPRLKQLKTPADKVRFALRKLKERLERLEPVSVRARLDGKDVSGDYLMFEALNIAYVGPNLFLAPDSNQGDEQFDLVMVTEAERDRLSHYIDHWQEKKPRLAVLPSHQGKRLHVDWTGFRVHVDDEFWPEEEDEKPQSSSAAIDLRMEGAAVEVLAPADPKAQNSKHR